jgi:hypothetical protein
VRPWIADRRSDQADERDQKHQAPYDWRHQPGDACTLAGMPHRRCSFQSSTLFHLAISLLIQRQLNSTTVELRPSMGASPVSEDSRTFSE